MQLGNRQFFNLFLRLVTVANGNRDCDEWLFEGVRWRRNRHIHWGTTSFQLEVHRLSHETAGWTLLFGREIWWSADRRKAIRDSCWTHVEAGARRDVLKWFGDRERNLERKDTGWTSPKSR